jgi:hypothetical protein
MPRLKPERKLLISFRPIPDIETKSSLRRNILVERQMPSANERTELEKKIRKYGQLARLAPDLETSRRIKELVVELERKLRDIDK